MGYRFISKYIHFDEFLSIRYDDADNYLQKLSESKEVIEMFDNLYKKVMSIK